MLTFSACLEKISGGGAAIRSIAQGWLEPPSPHVVGAYASCTYDERQHKDLTLLIVSDGSDLASARYVASSLSGTKSSFTSLTVVTGTMPWVM